MIERQTFSNKQRLYSLWIAMLLVLMTTALVYGPVMHHMRMLKSCLLMYMCLLVMSWTILADKNYREQISFLGCAILMALLGHVGYGYAVGLISKTTYQSELYVADTCILLFFAYLVWKASLRMGKPDKVWRNCAPLFIIFGIWGVIQLLASRERLQLSFGNPNFMACYLVGFIPLFTSGIFWAKSRVWALAAFIGAVICLLGTQSRGGISAGLIATILSCIVSLSIIHRKQWLLIIKTGAILSGATIICGYVLWIIHPSLFARLFELYYHLEYYLQYRLVPWRAAWNLWQQSPFFGHGLGSFYYHIFGFVSNISAYPNPVAHPLSYAHVHCEYLELLVDGGIIGLMWWATPVALVLYHLGRIIGNDKCKIPKRLLACGISCGITGMLLHGLFTVALRISTTLIAFYFLLGLALWLIDTEQRYSLRVSGHHVTLIAFLPVFLASLTIFRYSIAEKLILNARYENKLASTIALMEKALTWHRENIYLLDRLTNLYFKLGDIDKAYQYAIETDKIIPQYRNTDLTLACLYAKKGDLKNAWYHLTRYQKIYPYLQNGYVLELYLHKKNNNQALYRETLARWIRAMVIKKTIAITRTPLSRIRFSWNREQIPLSIRSNFQDAKPGYQRFDSQVWVYVAASILQTSSEYLWTIPMTQQHGQLMQVLQSLVRNYK